MISAKEARTLSDNAIEKLTEYASKCIEDKIKEQTKQGSYYCVVPYQINMKTEQIKEVLEKQGYNVKDSIYPYPNLRISWE